MRGLRGRAAAVRPLARGPAPLPAPASYAGASRGRSSRLKRGERALLDPLAALLAPLVPAGAVLVPLVTPRRRAAERGFDQAAASWRAGSPLCAAAACADVLRKRGPAQRGSDGPTG